MERGVLIMRPMKPSFRRSLPLAAALFASAGLAQAHPGHDGHELTWDFSAGHLAGHPLATMACALVLVTSAWALARLVGAGGERLSAAVRRRSSDRRD